MKQVLITTTALALASAPLNLSAQSLQIGEQAAGHGSNLNISGIGLSQSAENDLQIELPEFGNGKRALKSVLPPFGNLWKYTGPALERFVNTLIGEVVNGYRINGAVPLIDQNLILITNAHTLEIHAVRQGKVILTGFDEHGNPIENLKVDALEGSGDVNCLATEALRLSKTSPVQARFQVLMDVSGSMEDSMGDVIAASLNFINGVPRNAYCRVVAYNNSYSVVDANNGYGGWKLCEAKNWNLSRLKASGGTNSTTALLQSFADLTAHHPYFLPKEATMISGLVVITDGDGVNAGDIATIKKTKNDIPVFAYFEGHETSTSYEQWVERYLSASDGVDVVNAFQTFSNTYLNARVVDPGVCGG